MQVYAPSPPVNSAIMFDFESKVACLSGPVGTGKSHDAVGMSMLIQMTHQRPFNGVRRTKFIVVRKNYGELKNSIVKEIEDSIIPDSGEKTKFINTTGAYPTVSEVRFQMDDGTRVECDILYFAFEDEAASKKIKSIDFTSGFIVEAQQLSGPGVISDIWQRCRRYPNAHQGGICFQVPDKDGSIKEYNEAYLRFDINLTAKSHWMHKYLVENNKDIEIGGGSTMPARTHYRQPSAFIFNPNPNGKYKYKGQVGDFIDNPEFDLYTKNQPLGRRYWRDLLDQWSADGDDDKIQRDLMGEFGTLTMGKAVHSNYQPTLHQTDDELQYIPGIPIYVGVDNGKDNCWIFAQEDWNGGLRIIDEIINAGPERQKLVTEAISEDVGPYIRRHFPDYSRSEIIFVLDPAMDQAESNYGTKQEETVAALGVTKYPRTHKFQPRLDAVSWYLRGNRLMLSNKCTFLADALSGGYHYALNKSTGMYSDTPKKNEYSHAAEAFQQLCLYMRHGQRKKNAARKYAKQRKYNWL